MSSSISDPPLLLAGAGLANSLIASHLAKNGFDRFVLIESGAHFGGDHTWSYFENDVSSALQNTLELWRPAQWSSHQILFPGEARQLSYGYRSLHSAQCHRHLVSTLRPQQMRLGQRVTQVDEDRGLVTLADGEVLGPGVILDGRGADAAWLGPSGYQKFVGWQLETSAPHGLTEPVIMDATVEQIDGFRFVYVLPFSPTHVLIEDTRYSDGPEIDLHGFECELRTYIEQKLGLKDYQVRRKEVAALPIPLTSQVFENCVRAGAMSACVGVRGGWFHPVTGYSVPQAAQVAEIVLQAAREDLWTVPQHLLAAQSEWRRQWEFLLVLNRMLFGASKPAQRIQVFQHFYTKPEELVRRFYAGRVEFRDRLRILSGRPPVSIFRAAKSLLDKSWIQSFN